MVGRCVVVSAIAHRNVVIFICGACGEQCGGRDVACVAVSNAGLLFSLVKLTVSDVLHVGDLHWFRLV